MEVEEDVPKNLDVEMDENESNWLGTSLKDLWNNSSPWNFAVTPVIAAKYHHVLYELPAPLHRPPRPHISKVKHWDEDFVRMPYSPNSKFIVTENDEEIVKPRWDIITAALSKEINCVDDLEKAINTYNKNLPKFKALHYFFNEALEEEETIHFFQIILPGVIKLALQLPEILPGNIPYLKQNTCKSVSLSQLQVASLMANAFLCTFLWRKDLDLTRPGVNFLRLFAAHGRPKRDDCVVEKLKCICHYFKRVISKVPVGCITFEKKFIPKKEMPRWDNLDNNLGNTKIHVSSPGTIEDCEGFLQVDFANRFIGGGVLGYGCVQEEIRFVICPELIISRLFVDVIGDNEAVTITGVERFSNYKGYGDTFKWAGNCEDDIPFDEYRRRRTSIVVIDATCFHKPDNQFHNSAILRELNKAYVGFHSREKHNIAPVATGNWGCGAFKGSVHLKSLIQLMACTAAGRNLVYFTFGDDEFKRDFYNLHTFLGTNRIAICELWRHLCKFSIAKLPPMKLFAFVQQSHFDSKTQPTIKDFFGRCFKKTEAEPSTSSASPSSSFTSKLSEKIDSNKKSPEQKVPMNINKQKVEQRVYKPLEIVIERKEKKKLNEEKSDDSDIFEILNLFDDCRKPLTEKKEPTSLLEELDKIKRPVKNKKEETCVEMEVEEIAEIKEEKRSKITDYFQRGKI